MDRRLWRNLAIVALCPALNSTQLLLLQSETLSIRIDIPFHLLSQIKCFCCHGPYLFNIQSNFYIIALSMEFMYDLSTFKLAVR